MAVKVMLRQNKKRAYELWVKEEYHDLLHSIPKIKCEQL